MPPKKKASEADAADKGIKKVRVARKPKAKIVEKVEEAKAEGGEDRVEMVEVKLEGDKTSEKKPRATRAKRIPLSLEEIAAKARGLVPGVTESVEAVNLGIIYSQEVALDDVSTFRMESAIEEDDEEDNTCYICMCEPCQWELYKDDVVVHMRGVEEELFATCRDVNDRNNKVRFAGYTYFNQTATRSKERKRLPKCVEEGIRSEYPSATYTGFRER
jgi:hypothetical protein